MAANRLRLSLRRGLLAGVGCLAGALQRGERGRARRKLLVIRPDHLGDVLMTTAALAALRTSEPTAEVTALVGPWSADLLRRNRDLDRVLVYPFPWFDRRPAGLIDRYASATRLAASLRRDGFDRVYVLRPDHWWGAMVGALAGIPERVGYATAENRSLLTHAYAPPGREHAVRSALRLVAGEDAARCAVPGCPPMRFCPGPAHRRWAEAVLTDAAVAAGSPLAVAHPGASTPLKRWPADRWAVVLDHLAADGVAVVLVGGGGDQSALEAIAAQMRARPHVVGEVPGLGELGALLARASFALGMDSLPMHLATAVGTPTLRLVGPADEAVFGPWGDPRQHRVARAPGTAPDPEWFGSPASSGPHPTLLALSVDVVVTELARLREALEP